MILTVAVAAAGAGAMQKDVRRFDGKVVAADQIAHEATRLMAAARVRGLAMAVIDDGKAVFVRAWGHRNVEKNLPLQTDTIMYGASLTKLAFAYMVMQLVDEGKVHLDRPIAEDLPKPLPEFPFYAALKDDDRWRKWTPRILLSHRSGLANFAFLEPDEKMRIHFSPGSRYAYSGEGIQVMQFVLETGLGLDVGAEMQRRVFDRFDMTRTSMTWRADFADNAADGYGTESFETHARRSRPRAAGSMDTTIVDISKFVAGLLRGEGLSERSRDEMVKPQLAIDSARQFPTLVVTEPSASMQAAKLSAGLGLVTFEGPFGRGFFKGGHNDTTGNQAICVEKSRRCVVFLANDVRAESIFQRLTEATVGDPGMPWAWEGYTPYRQQP